MSYNVGKAITVLLCIALTLSSLVGCGNSEKNKNTASEAPIKDTAGIVSENMFSDKDKETKYDHESSEKINLSESASVNITKSGTYILCGTLSCGSITVDAASTDKITLVFSGVNISSDSGAAVYIKQAEKVFITLEEGTVNKLTQNSDMADGETNVDGVLFSKDDLTINGNGSLELYGNSSHGIVVNDDLAIISGNIKINALSHAISANDSIRIAGGKFEISCGKDGLKAENTDDASLGFIYIEGGEFDISCDGDGISASSALEIINGKFNIVCGGGCYYGYSSESAKGIKSTAALAIKGGSIEIDSADDAIHSNSTVYYLSADSSIKTGDDGIHADDALLISGGKIEIKKSYEGLEGVSIEITDGKINILANDDGLNAAGGNDASGKGGFMMRPDKFESSSDSYIVISGGKILVDSKGDGIDSNGDLTVNGGEIYVWGPTNSGNGALDYGGISKITGGIFVACGASGMAQGFGTASTQGAILYNFASYSSASRGITLSDRDGNILLACEPEKTYSSVVISCPEIRSGSVYTLSACGQTVSINMTSIIYGTSSGMGGMGGGRPPR